MAELTVANYLAALQEDPWSKESFDGLQQALASKDPKRTGDDPVRLLEFARRQHEVRGESFAAAKLIELELELTDDPDFEVVLCRELGRVRREDLMDDAGAIAAYERALGLAPGHEATERALEQLRAAAERWQEIAEHFIAQAEQASDATLKTSLLVRAASILWQHKKKGKNKEVDRLFRAARQTDPASARAARLFEITLRAREKWKELGEVLYAAAKEVSGRDDQLGLLLAAARVLAKHLDDRARAAECYERVLELTPAHEESLGFLVSYFTENEMWDHLVAVYEDALRARQLKADAEQGILLQIAMVQWRMLGRPERAEPYFARVRRGDPSQPVMLDFYRGQYTAEEDRSKLLAVLSDAQRRAADEAERVKLSLEIARLAQDDPQGFERAIDAWKIVLRHDASHAEAVSALKTLYRRSGKWNALVELLRVEVDALPADDVHEKLSLLRELLEIYRDELKLEAMVIATYNAILQVDPGSQDAAAELARTYEAMGRWSDLIPVLTREAELAEDPKRKVELYSRVAKLWIEHFSNYNQATAPLEQVLALEPDNREALAQLKEIYSKKRAWKPLYGVLKKEEELATDREQKRVLLTELASLAGERLHEYGDAIALNERVLEIEPGSSKVLDALEKLAERAKDWEALARAIEHRVTHAEDDATKIKLLSRLGSLHAERTRDPQRAADAWQRVLSRDPKNGRAMRTLRETYLAAGDFDGVEILYSQAGDFEGFVDVLGTAADKTEDPELKTRLSFRAAEIYEGELGEPARAFRSYERVLSVDPENERAIRALLPLYEKDDKWQRVHQLLEVLLAQLPESAEAERLTLLKRLTDVAQQRLREGERAMQHASRAYALAPHDEEVRARLEAAAELSHAEAKLAEIYAARADREQGEAQVALRRRVAALFADKLKRPEEAAKQLEKLLEGKPSDQEASQILERIYRSMKQYEPLRRLLSRRLELTDDKAQRIHLLTELGKLEEHELFDIDGAIARYRALSELEPTHDATLATLDRLLLGQGAHAEHAAILDKRIALAPSPAQRLELTLRLGMSAGNHLGDVDRALSAFTSVLEIDPNEARAVSALESLAEKFPAESRRIGHILEPVYDRTMALDKLSKVLEQRLGSTTDRTEKRALKLRIAEIAGTKGDPRAAYTTLESAFLDSPANPELWDRLSGMAEQAGTVEELAVAFATAVEAADLSPEDVAELSARTAKVYDEQLGQPEKAEPFHVRVLAHDPLAETAYESLRELYTNAERWDDLKALYRNRIANTVDPHQKLDLLLQVCFLFEEILDDVDMAIRAYEEVLALEPLHPTSMRALERLYTRAERFRDLVGLLETDRQNAEGKEAIELTFRIGELYELKLKEASQAVDQYASVLEEQPTHLRAQEALERLIGDPGQRQRIAGLLEPLYTAQGAHAELARVLEVQLEALTDPGARVSALMRVAELHENHLDRMSDAFAAYVRAIEADPGDATPRKELARLAAATDKQVARSQVLERALERAVRGEVRTEILGELAELYDLHLADATRAIDAYQKLIASDPDNAEVVLPAARALERLHLMAEDHASLAQALRLQVQFELDLDKKRDLLGQLAELREHRLADVPGAIEAWVERLDLDSADLPAMVSLERLYEAGEDWLHLIGVLQKHEVVAGGEDEARAIARRVGALYESKLGDHESAIAAYNDVLSRFGNDRDTLSALQRVYEVTERHQDLLDTLEIELELVSDPAERAEVRFRAAELMRKRTGALEAALESYRSVLEEQPAHGPTLSALQEMVAAGGHMRIDAARALVPYYEATDEHDRLIRTLEVVAETDDPGERLSALRRAAEVAERGLSESGRAFALMGRAVKVALSEHDLGLMLDELDRLSQVAGRFEAYVQLLRDIAPDVADEELSRVVLTRIAKVSRDKLGHRALAREYFERALALRPDDAEVLDALEELHLHEGDYRALLEVLRTKTELSSEAVERTKLLMRQAELCADKLDDVPAAIDAYERVLEERAAVEVFAGLEGLYRRATRWADLGTMYERQMETEIGDMVEVRFKLGELERAHLDDDERALELFADVLTRAPLHQATRAALEGMLENPQLRPRAAELLEPVYLRASAWPELSRALEAQLEAEDDTERKKDLLSRLAQLHEVQLEDLDAALETYARLFRVDPTDTHTAESLSRLARVLGKPLRVAEVYEQFVEEVGIHDEVAVKIAVTAAGLREQHGADLERASALYQRALEFDPTDPAVARALEQVLERKRAPDELRAFYRTQADLATDNARRVAYLQKLARVLERELAETDEAVRVYHEVLEASPHDNEATEALDRLLSQSKRWSDLADHLRSQIDAAIGSPKELELKLRLATLYEEHLVDVASAIDVYEDIARVDPGNEGARAALERLAARPELLRRVAEILAPLYQANGEWQKEIWLNEQLFNIETDSVGQVRLLLEIAQLYEERGQAPHDALRAFRRALEVDPRDDQARLEVERVASSLGDWDGLVEAYEGAVAAANDSHVKAGLLSAIAKVHDERRGDPRAAITAYERLVQADPDDIAAMDELEALLTMVGDWRGLVSLLERKVARAADSFDRAELWRRAGSVLDELLADTDAAIIAYRSALSEVDDDATSLEALDRLYQRAGDFPSLADVLRRRADLAADAEERIDANLRLGQVLSGPLDRTTEAIDAYRRVLDDEPAHREAIDALSTLFQRESMWTDLLDNLRRSLDLAEDDTSRVELTQRIGELEEQHLDEIEAALDSYSAVLGLAPTHEPSIQALMRIGETAEWRLRVQEILEPVLRTHERWDELATIMARSVSAEADPIDRQTRLVRLAEVHEQGRRDQKAAFDALCEALAQDADDETLHAEIERLASSDETGWLKAADAFEKRARATSDAYVARELCRRVARIAETALNDLPRAIQANVRALEQGGDDPALLAELDRLYTATGRNEELSEVLERRVAQTADAHEAASLLVRLGELRETAFQDGAGALTAYREVLEREPLDPRAVVALERLLSDRSLAPEIVDILDGVYRQAGDMARVAELYETRISLAGEGPERITLLMDLASLWERELNEFGKAVDALKRAFELDQTDFGLLDEIERVAVAGGAAEALRGIVEAACKSQEVSRPDRRDLWMRAARWYREHVRDNDAARTALEGALEVDAEHEPAHEALTQLLRDGERYRDLVRALGRWAEREADRHTAIERLREAARIAEGPAEDLDGAIRCYEKVLELDGGDTQALDQLIRIHEATAREGKVVQLLDRRIDAESSPDERVALRQRAADMRERLSDRDGAIRLHVANLDDEPTYRPALLALERLHEEAEHWDEFASVLARHLDVADSPEERVTVRVKLALVAEQKLGQTKEAIDQLSELLAETPDHPEANEALERLLAKEGRHDELVAQLERRADRARDLGDEAEELRVLVRMGEALHLHVGDRERAAQCYERVLERDPEHVDALRALSSLYVERGDSERGAEILERLLGRIEGEELVSVAHQLAELSEQQLNAPGRAQAALLRAAQAGVRLDETQKLQLAFYERQGDYASLAELLGEQVESIEDVAERVTGLRRIAEIYRDKLTDPRRACDYLERASQLVPDDRSVLVPLCELYIEAGRQESAVPVLEKIIASYGGRRVKEIAIYHRMLANAYRGMGDAERALGELDAAYRVDLTNVAVLVDLGMLCYERGDLERAQKTFRGLLLQRLDKDAPITKADVYFYLGDIAGKQGDKPKAISMLERAVAEQSDHLRARELLDSLRA